nr:hypothetical protein [Actinomycetota bacterium]
DGRREPGLRPQGGWQLSLLRSALGQRVGARAAAVREAMTLGPEAVAASESVAGRVAAPQPPSLRQ